jgi:hypothetical protein
MDGNYCKMPLPRKSKTGAVRWPAAIAALERRGETGELNQINFTTREAAREDGHPNGGGCALHIYTAIPSVSISRLLYARRIYGQC